MNLPTYPVEGEENEPEMRSPGLVEVSTMSNGGTSLCVRKKHMAWRNFSRLFLIVYWN